MHLRSVFKALSIVILFIAFIMVIPTILAFVWDEEIAFNAFVKTVEAMAIFGVAILLLTKKGSMAELSQKDGFLFTTLTWVLATLFGALPLFLTKTLPCYSDCFFEIMSGFTTTGASRLVDIESCMRSILFWRSLSNWLGGMGIVVLFVAILPALGAGAGAFNLIGAETVGPVKSKLTPKTKTTALVLWLIYLGLTALETILLLFGHVGLFDALTTTFSTVSTAGFSVKNLSIGAYNSAYIEVIVTIFMLFAAINFSLYYKALKGKWNELKVDTELKFFLFVVAFTSIAGAIALFGNKVCANFGQALRYMAFHVASIISTTGFTCTTYLNWPSFCVMLLIMLMFVGGCAGSTGGGIKAVRLCVISKAAKNSLNKKIHQNGIYKLTINNQIMGDDTISSIFTFGAIYIATWIIGAVIISISGTDITNCLSSSILTLGNIGIGFGDKAFSTFPHWCNWVFSFLMLSGRLELMTVYVLFTRAFRNS